MNRPKVLLADWRVNHYLHQMSTLYRASSPIRVTFVYTLDAVVQQLRRDSFALVFLQSNLPVATPKAESIYLKNAGVVPVVDLLEGFLRPSGSSLKFPPCKTGREARRFVVFTTTKHFRGNRSLSHLGVATVALRENENLFDEFVRQIELRLQVKLPINNS